MNPDTDLIVKALERAKQIQDTQSTGIDYADEKQYKISVRKREKIQSIVNDVDRYDSVNEFIDESIDMIVDFWLHPEKMQETALEMWPSFTLEMKEQIKKNAPVFYQNMMQATEKHNKIAAMTQQIINAKIALRKEKFSVPENIVLGDAYSLMHQSYNRFFPLKILVTTLGLMIEENRTQENKFDVARWVGYKEFLKEGFDISLEFSKKLKVIKGKEKNDDKRTNRISTGLPIQHEMVYGKEKETIENDEKSKQRFFDCFIGGKETSVLRLIDDANKEEKKKLVISGALNETGLVHLRNNNGKLEITLSEDGFEFFNYDNPIIKGIKITDYDNGAIEFSTYTDDIIEKKIFSEEENEFIMKKIIPNFTLEKKIVDGIINTIKKDGKVNADVLDGKDEEQKEKNSYNVITKTIEEWKDENQAKAMKEKIDTTEEKIKTCRIATMGRLAEIGVIEWEIVGGKSFYSIST